MTFHEESSKSHLLCQECYLCFLLLVKGQLPWLQTLYFIWIQAKMDILYRMYQERQAMLRKLPTTPPYPYDPDELCGHSAKNDTIVTSTRFYVAGVSLGATAFLGILGNLLSIITLWTLTKRGLFIKLLLALTCFDLIFLCSGKLWNWVMYFRLLMLSFLHFQVEFSCFSKLLISTTNSTILSSP